MSTVTGSVRCLHERCLDGGFGGKPKSVLVLPAFCHVCPAERLISDQIGQPVRTHGADAAEKVLMLGYSKPPVDYKQWPRSAEPEQRCSTRDM